MSQIQEERTLTPAPPEETPPSEKGRAGKKKSLIDLILWGALGVLVIGLAIAVFNFFGGGPSAELRSVEFVPSITSDGVTYQFEGQDIVQVQLDFTFGESLTAGLDPTSADFRGELFDRLAAGAHFFDAGEEVERTFGYWPKEADADSAQELSLFYLVPSGSAEDLRFTFDASVLGDGASGIDTVVNP